MLDLQSKIRLVNVFTATQLQRLQKLQNAATRWIFHWKERRGVTSLRKKLHFLPVKARIVYKVSLLMYHVVQGNAPEYLTKDISRRPPKPMTLRANSDNTLLEERLHGGLRLRHKMTKRAISIAGPSIWNSLPRKIRELETVGLFKKYLKHHLFREAYNLP